MMLKQNFLILDKRFADDKELDCYEVSTNDQL